MSEKSNQNVKQELSEEELIAKREEITAFYSENIKHLTVQLQYEEMLRDIEKARAERVQAQMFLAQSMAAQTTENEEPNKETHVAPPLPSKRSLKKVSNEV